jgi:hypothetical protein
VERFLRQQADYPIFGKPTNRMCSLGVSNIERYDRASDSVVTRRGEPVRVSDFAEQVETFAEGGYLFQRRMAPHPDTVDVVGDQIGTVRMFVLADDEGPVLLRAAWKIPGGESLADNFWRAGNMLAGIDIETGRVTRVLRRTARSTQVVTKHPKTGASFEGLVFPHWDEMRAIVMRGAAAVPSCHLQGWDVALTDRGPILVELEGDGGDPIMEQLCFDIGLLQGRYLAFVNKAFANEKEHKKKVKACQRDRLRQNFSQLAVRGQTKEHPVTMAASVPSPEPELVAADA